MSDPMLTTARRAVWNAIDTWDSLANLFHRRFMFEDYPGRVSGRPRPALGELPALGIYPDSARTAWAMNQLQEIRYPLRIELWTREWDVCEGERIWEEIIKVLYQNLSSSEKAFPRVIGFSPLSPRPVMLGETKDGPLATLWTFQVEISAGFWDPKTASH